MTDSGTTDNDVKMAELRRGTMRDQGLINAGRVIGSILAVAVCIGLLQGVVTPFAGADSGFTLDIGLTGVSWGITVTVSLAGSASGERSNA